MELERTSELSSGRKDAEHAESGPAGPTATNHSPMGGVKPTQGISEIGDGLRMSNPPPFPNPSASPIHQQPHHNNGPSTLVATDEDFPSGGSSSEVLQIISPRRSPAKNNGNLSRRPSEASKCISTSTSSSPSPSISMSGVRAEIRPLPNPATKAIYKLHPPQPRSNRSVSSSNNDEPPLSKRRKTHHHHTPLDAHAVSNLKSSHWSSSSPTSVTASASLDPNNLPMFAYDLDSDPTEQPYEFRDQFHERSPYSAILSARFVHPHLFGRLSNLATSNDELVNGGDLAADLIEAAALNAMSLQDVAIPSYPLGPAEVVGNSGSAPPDGDLDLEGAGHRMDPFFVPTVDDVINGTTWGGGVGIALDPRFFGGAPTFSEPRYPSPSPAPFRDFHSLRRTRTPSPHPTQSALAIRIPSHAPASTSRSDRAENLGDPTCNLGGGKAKFYKNGALQAPPHLSSSQRRRSASTGATESTHTSRYPSPDQMAPPGMDSPLTELSASDLPPPRVTVAARNQKSGVGQKQPYRNVALKEGTNCHQCRNTTLTPKMCCRACSKRYCVVCIVKRYPDIEFHQFKKNFDCPACVDVCNCTACCYRRGDDYITTRHVRFDKETTAKLMSGEIRSSGEIKSLPNIFPSLAGPKKKLKSGQDPIPSSYRESPPSPKGGKALTRRKRVPPRRYISEDDFGESDASETRNVNVRVKPTQAALQTQKMLEESGSGRYWGAVYSLNGERIGMSYVGNNLRGVTLQTMGHSSTPVTDHSPSPSRQQRRRVYVGRWQETWDSRPETSDGSHSEGETRANKRSRNKELDRSCFHYIGNQNIVRAWRKAQPRVPQRPPVTPLPPSDDIDIHAPPSDPHPLDAPSACEAPPNDDISADGGEDEGDRRPFWIIEDGSPKKTKTPLRATTSISQAGQNNDSNVLDPCPTSALGSRGQLVTQEDLIEAVTSGLQAVGTSVLLPEAPLLSS